MIKHLLNLLCSLLHFLPVLMLIIGYKLQQPLWLIPILAVPWSLYYLLSQPQLKACALEVFHFQLNAMLLYLPVIGLLRLSSNYLTGDGQKAMAFLFGAILTGLILLYLLMILIVGLTCLFKEFRYPILWRPLS